MTKHQYSLKYQSEHIRRARTPRWIQPPSNFRGLVWKKKRKKEQTVRTCWQAGAGSKQLSLHKPCFSWARRIKKSDFKNWCGFALVVANLLTVKNEPRHVRVQFWVGESILYVWSEGAERRRGRRVFCVWQEQNRALVQTVQRAWRGAVDLSRQQTSRIIPGLTLFEDN